MALLWFLAGFALPLACIVLLLPWLRTIPGFGSLPAPPWQAGIGALVVIAATIVAYKHFAPNAPPEAHANAVVDAARSMNLSIGAPAPIAPVSAPQKSAAGSMNAAIASLQARLAKGGGGAADWELLAKSYEFLGRQDDAGMARARQLPPLPPEEGPAMAGPPAATGTSVRGEISISAPLRNKAAAGATLFIVAKSVDSPGPPVAVMRTTVGTWPLNFTLDDSQSMLPGRNLTSAGRVTVEARISPSGQPLATAGDLQGSSGVIKTAERAPLHIVIDRVVP